MSQSLFVLSLTQITLGLFLCTASTNAASGAQTRAEADDARTELEGRWVYRSFRPFRPLSTPFNDIRFGAGIIEFNVEGDEILRSSLDMGSNYKLEITGQILRDAAGEIQELAWRGVGIADTPTEGWIYDYRASVAPTFAGQTNLSPVLIGQTVRTVAHGSAPAGVTGPFFMVLERESAPPTPTSPPAPRMSLKEFAEFDKVEFKTETRQEIRNGEIVEVRTFAVDRDDRSPEAKRRLASLMRGVRVMKSRPPSDPTSWFFQAAVHGVSDEEIQRAADRDPGVIEFIRSGQTRIFWNQCPHNGQPSADFLVWHRAYVHYFERILRDAAGDPELSLPFWNYTGDEPDFPLMFQLRELPEGDEPVPVLSVPTNPLFDADRAFAMAVRGATGLHPRVAGAWDGVVGEQPGLKDELDFFGATEDTGFAGGVYDENPRTKGLIEVQPHDNVHIAVGGLIADEAGRMADVQQAAFDPIFWVHHVNIDRLWVKWDNLTGRRWGGFPSAAWFIETPWSFYDSDGTVKSHRRSYYFNNANLSVRYSDVADLPTRLSASLPFDLGALDSQLARMDAELVEAADSGTPQKSRLEAMGGPQAVAAEFPPIVVRPTFEPQQFLDITFTTPRGVPNAGFDVVVSFMSPSGDRVRRRVAGLGIFGAGHHHGGHQGKHTMSDAIGALTQRINVSSLFAESGFSVDSATVELVPYPLLMFIDKPVEIREGGVELRGTTFIE